MGRYKVNQKLGLKAELEQRILESADIVAATKYLVRLKRGVGVVDDIDHLGSRRVRTVGELLANQCRVGLSRTERLVRERMTMYDQSVDSITPQKLINPKALTTVIRDFLLGPSCRSSWTRLILWRRLPTSAVCPPSGQAV